MYFVVNSCKIFDLDYCLLAHKMFFPLLIGGLEVSTCYEVRNQNQNRTNTQHAKNRCGSTTDKIGDAYQLIPSKTDKTLLITTDKFCLSEYF